MRKQKKKIKNPYVIPAKKRIAYFFNDKRKKKEKNKLNKEIKEQLYED